MPQKSKAAWQKAVGITMVGIFCHPSDFPNAEINITTPEPPSSNAELIRDLDINDING